MTLDTRAAAAQVIGDVLAGKSLNQALPPRLSRVATRDRALLQQLCFGTLRQAPRLQAFLSQLLDKPLRDKDRDVQALLLAGLYQLASTRVPDHAAVNSTVKATAALKKNWARGLTNAVLRRFLREREQLVAALDSASAQAHPQWLYDTLGEQWPQHRAQIIAANNEQPPMVLRVNLRRHSREDYLALLNDHGIAGRAGQLCPEAIYLDQPVDVQALPGFAEGAVSVQDEAAQVAAHLLQVQPGDNVLDACAAPGGKTCHLLERTPDIGQLLAMDSDEQRLARVTENLQRLALDAETRCADAAQPPATLAAGSFDRILVDAPCSASGVIRRHPDVKLLRRPGDTAQFATQQQNILLGLWPLLKPGGTLLYATCSLFEEENSGVVAAFIARQSDVEPLPIETPRGEARALGRQLLPDPAGHDGLFYALLRKTR